MAALALQRLMRAVQRKPGLGKVVVLVLPLRLPVTVTTLAAESAVMLVVGAMASIAVFRRFFDRHVVKVACAADQFLVTARQCKTGLFEMVERDPAPFGRVVARRTVRTATATMYVIGAMAGHAGLRQPPPDLVNMATLADHIDVRAQQVECRLRMVETNIGPRPILTVASRTFFAQALHVRLRLAMAGGAFDRRFSELLALRVTGAAVATHMAAAQREIRSIVIECRTIQTHDVGITTLVLGVTVLAQKPWLIFRDAAMEPRQRRHVGTNFLVTIHTQSRLLARDKRSMTIRTIVF